MAKKQDKIIGNIDTILDNGVGVLKHKDEMFFVRNAIVNEKVEIVVDKKIKGGYAANIVRILEESNSRIKPACPYFERCGSCHLLHMKYEEQLKLKKQMIVDMTRQQHYKIKVHDCVGMEEPYAYRNKIIISFGMRKKEVVSGFYEEYSHRIIPIKSCLLHEEKVNTLIEDLKVLVKKCRIEVYDEDRGTGFLRHILIRRAVDRDATMIVLVGAEKIFKAKNNFIKALKQMHPEIDTVIFNYNPRRTSVVLGNEEQVLYGKGFVVDTLCDKKFKISSKSFYQINHEQCEKLYTKALSLFSLQGNETVIDAYCGVGTIGLIASSKFKKVYGVEINKDAIKDAIENAKQNNIKNVQFTCADAGKFMVDMARKKERIDAVILDPARDGSDENFLSSLVKMNPKQVVYISCNPKTQIRDLKYLAKHGYMAKDMYLYDLFPHTFHVESIVFLSKKKTSNHKF